MGDDPRDLGRSVTQFSAEFYRAGQTEVSSRNLIEQAHSGRATDIHLNSCHDVVAVLVRVDGFVREIARIPKEDGEAMMRYFKVGADLSPVGHAPQQGNSTFFLKSGESHDLRISALPGYQGEKVSIRFLNTEPELPSLEDLGMSDGLRDWLRDWTRRATGLVVVTGPTGAGKSTTLYALLDELRRSDPPLNMITLEDPVERVLDGVTQIEVKPELELDFRQGLRCLLRHDPDLVFIGEIRDAHSARAAMEAAFSGHAIITTLHARDTAGVVSLLRGYGMGDHEIAAGLAGVVSQRLVRQLAGEKPQLSEDEAEWLQSQDLHLEQVPVGSTEGARDYQGRTGVYGWWKMDDTIYDALLRGIDERAFREVLNEVGVQTLLDDGLEKVRQGKTSVEEIRRVLGAQALS